MTADLLRRCRRRVSCIAAMTAFVGGAVLIFSGYSYFNGFRGRVFKSGTFVSAEAHNTLIQMYAGVAFVLLPILGVFFLVLAYGWISETKPLLRQSFEDSKTVQGSGARKVFVMVIGILLLTNVGFLGRRVLVLSEVRAIRRFLAEAPVEFGHVRIERSKPGMFVLEGTVPTEQALRSLSECVARTKVERFVVHVNVANAEPKKKE